MAWAGLAVDLVMGVPAVCMVVLRWPRTQKPGGRANADSAHSPAARYCRTCKLTCTGRSHLPVVGLGAGRWPLHSAYEVPPTPGSHSYQEESPR